MVLVVIVVALEGGLALQVVTLSVVGAEDGCARRWWWQRFWGAAGDDGGIIRGGRRFAAYISKMMSL